MSTPPPTPEQLQIWRDFRKMNDQLGTLITRDLTGATGLSGAEYGILGYLEEVGQGTLRQADLGDATGWHKSRLSHLLTRMQERGLIERRPAGRKGVIVHITEQGQTLRRQGRPIHEHAVYEHFIAKLEAGQLLALQDITRRLEVDAAER